MASPESIELIRRVKAGDRKAWGALYERYYPRWRRKFQGKIGKALRRECDTEDLIQSGMTQVLLDIGDLRNEAAFYAWVCAVIRHKIASKSRRGGKARIVRLETGVDVARSDTSHLLRLATREEYERLLEEVLAVFPKYPEEMAALYFRYLERQSIQQLVLKFGVSARTVHRLIEEGLDILRARLGDK